MQNQILHPAQHTRKPAQVSKRIGTRIIESGANFFYVNFFIIFDSSLTNKNQNIIFTIRFFNNEKV
jgi:hypothetical protein